MTRKDFGCIYFLVIGAPANVVDKVECEVGTTPVSNTIECVIENLDLLLAECSFDEGPFQTCKLSYAMHSAHVYI